MLENEVSDGKLPLLLFTVDTEAYHVHEFVPFTYVLIPIELAAAEMVTALWA